MQPTAMVRRHAALGAVAVLVYASNADAFAVRTISLPVYLSEREGSLSRVGWPLKRVCGKRRGDEGVVGKSGS